MADSVRIGKVEAMIGEIEEVVGESTVQGVPGRCM